MRFPYLGPRNSCPHSKAKPFHLLSFVSGHDFRACPERSRRVQKAFTERMGFSPCGFSPLFSGLSAPSRHNSLPLKANTLDAGNRGGVHFAEMGKSPGTSFGR